MGAEGKRYLTEHSIPQLFEGLMTGLIYNKPENPLDFLEEAIAKVKSNPDLALRWDTFIDPSQQFKNEGPPATATGGGGGDEGGNGVRAVVQPSRSSNKISPSPSAAAATTADKSSSGSHHGSAQRRAMNGGGSASLHRVPSVTKAAEAAKISRNVPIVLFIGGPGGGKTRVAAKVRDAMEDAGVVHICMPDLVKAAIAKYRDRYPEWRDAAERYQRGELIPNNLARDIVKAEMGRYPNAKAYFLEGFPREAQQVEEFEKNVRPINMALILDYDEETLRKHMQARGLSQEVMDRRINEFKQKTLPSAKYFDDQRLLHLIPGEKDDTTIVERMKKLINRAIELGVHVNVTKSNLSSSDSQRVDTATSSAEVQTMDEPPVSVAVADTQTVSPPRTSTSVQNGGSLPQTPIGQSPADRSKPPSAPKSAKSISTPAPVQTNELASRQASAHPATPQSVGASAASSQGSRQPSANGKPPSALPERPAEDRRMSSTVSTPHPSDGAYAEAATTASEETHPAVPSTNADKFPQGLPNNAPVILIIGGPGSQKTQFADRVAKKYDGFVYLSMGALLRRKVLENADDELWIRIGKKMDNGESIPIQICREVLYSALHQKGQGSWGYIVEGYPRSQRQVEDLEQQLGRLDVALLIDCTEQFCRSNLQARYAEGLEHGSERKDDAEDVVKTRLGLFKQNTLPMLKYLDDKGKLRVVRLRKPKIDGDTSNQEATFREITNVIDSALFIQENNNGRSLESSKQTSIDDPNK